MPECECRNGIVFTRKKGCEYIYACTCPLGDQYLKIPYKGGTVGLPRRPPPKPETLPYERASQATLKDE